jgi:thiamine-phosphate pyrophosphorylase
MSENLLQATYRILDACTNRAGEGLRTLEEYARFVLDDAGLTAAVKSLRHDLTAAIGRLPRQMLLQARDSIGDVGAQLSEPSEYNRANLTHVVAAAASRTQQSFRVLEEYGKTVDADVAAALEQLRYRCYTVCRDLEVKLSHHTRHELLAASRLYVLIDAGSDDDDFVARVRTLAAAGVDIIQLRDRRHDDRTLFHRAKIGATVANESGALFIVNDRADIAVAAEADGVHVGQDELPASEARKIVGTQRLVGVSTHSIDQVHAAIKAGADYIGCGPVFPSNTKSFDHYVGTDFLNEVHGVTSNHPLPAFAIGGISVEHLPAVLATGFHRIAVTAAVAGATDPAAAATELKGLLTEGESRRG